MLSGAAEPGVINHTRESRYQVPVPQLGAYHENAFSEAHAMGSTPWSQSHPQPRVSCRSLLVSGLLSGFALGW